MGRRGESLSPHSVAGERVCEQGREGTAEYGQEMEPDAALRGLSCLGCGEGGVGRGYEVRNVYGRGFPQL